jgi:hypothetical protein
MLLLRAGVPVKPCIASCELTSLGPLTDKELRDFQAALDAWTNED